jgi:hypothetical protein
MVNMRMSERQMKKQKEIKNKNTKGVQLRIKRNRISVSGDSSLEDDTSASTLKRCGQTKRTSLRDAQI